MDQLLEVRPEEMNAYVPAGELIRPENNYLSRTGMAVMVQGPPSPLLPGAFARRLARQFRGTPYDYEAYDGNPGDDAPYMLIMRGEALLEQIVWNNPTRSDQECK